jgi:hypothetical protein
MTWKCWNMEYRIYTVVTYTVMILIVDLLVIIKITKITSMLSIPLCYKYKLHKKCTYKDQSNTTCFYYIFKEATCTQSVQCRARTGLQPYRTHRATTVATISCDDILHCKYLHPRLDIWVITYLTYPKHDLLPLQKLACPLLQPLRRARTHLRNSIPLSSCYRMQNVLSPCWTIRHRQHTMPCRPHRFLLL